MASVFVVMGEHPFDPYYPLFVHSTEAAANQRAAEEVRELLGAYWRIAHEDEGDAPTVTPENWRQLVEQYGHDDAFVQDDAWGAWWVTVSEHELAE